MDAESGFCATEFWNNSLIAGLRHSLRRMALSGFDRTRAFLDLSAKALDFTYSSSATIE